MEIKSQKIFIKIVTLCTLLLIFNTTWGWERINPQQLIFTKSSQIVTNTIGWTKGVDGWIGHPNCIKQTNIGSGSYMLSHNKNFSTLQFKTVIYNDVEYFVLIMPFWTGGYKYPTIYEEWRYWEEVQMMIFSKQEYLKLFELENSNVDNINISEYIYCRTYCSNRSILNIIRSTLESNYKSFHTFLIYKASDGSIRFNYTYPDLMFKKNISSAYFECQKEEWDKLKLLWNS